MPKGNKGLNARSSQWKPCLSFSMPSVPTETRPRKSGDSADHSTPAPSPGGREAHVLQASGQDSESIPSPRCWDPEPARPVEQIVSQLCLVWWADSRWSCFPRAQHLQVCVSWCFFGQVIQRAFRVAVLGEDRDGAEPCVRKNLQENLRTTSVLVPLVTREKRPFENSSGFSSSKE